MSSTETIASTAATTSRNPSKGDGWADRLNRIDETVSRPIFRLGLPKYVEFFFSFPAHFFGTTFNLTVGPLWIALVAVSQQQGLNESEHNQQRILLLQTATFFAAAVYIVAWGRFQLGGRHDLGKKLFWNSLVFPLAYPWSVGIVAWTILGLENNQATTTTSLTPKDIVSIALYPLLLWPFVVIPMTELKERTLRSRPAKKDLDRGENGEHWTLRKKFPAMTYVLARHNGDASFPSGDVAMAMQLAISFWNLNGYLAGAIVLSSGLGRMYVLAHHLSDVLAGGLLTLVVHGAATLLGRGMFRTEWWHPLLAIASFVALVHCTNKGRNPMDKQAGGKEAKTD